MEFPFKAAILLLVGIINTGCVAIASLPYTLPHFSAPLSIWRSDDFIAGERVLTLLSRGPYDNNIKASLSQHGFSLRVNANRSKENVDTGFGLSFTYDRKQKCPSLNNEWLIKGFYEISDIKTGEVLLTIEKGGVTGSCGNVFRDQIFPELAVALSNTWDE